MAAIFVTRTLEAKQWQQLVATRPLQVTHKHETTKNTTDHQPGPEQQPGPPDQQPGPPDQQLESPDQQPGPPGQVA